MVRHATTCVIRVGVDCGMTTPSSGALAAATPGPSKLPRIIGWTLSGLGAAFMLFSASGKFLQPPAVSEMLGKLGWKMEQMQTIGVVEVACVVLFLIPRTSVLGAVLLTGYLGGATATHVRVGDLWVFPVVIGVVFWVALGLREPRMWALLPVTKRA